jgi:hypothetical protein
MSIDEKPSTVSHLYCPPKSQTDTELPKYLFLLTTSTPGTQPVILKPGSITPSLTPTGKEEDPTSQYSATLVKLTLKTPSTNANQEM